jgi:predicted membrane-bound mannosyltransferase/DNA-binding beta-propeller fold protein YncE
VKQLTTHLSEWMNQWVQSKPWRRIEIIIAAIILVLALITRFYNLEARVMSHDESEHTYFAWTFAENGHYQHTPITHGPLQFHLLALTYKLFGDTDATSRFPAALSGVIAIAMLFYFKRWLGRWGAIAAMALMLVSPYMLFYTRYVRNEPLILPVALLMFFSTFRYFETRQNRWLFLLAGSLTLHYLIKETAFIYSVELMIFMGGALVWRVLRQPWPKKGYQVAFLAGLVAFVAGAAILLLRMRTVAGVEGDSSPPVILLVGLALALLGLAAMIYPLVKTYAESLRTQFPELDILIVCITVTLPQLAAFPANLLGWDPLDYQNTQTMVKTVIVVVALVTITALIGLFWDWRKWQTVAAIFFFPFLVFYTTFFTNWPGMATGIVGSFGYWLAQQEVQRGGQPLYYYFAVQIPIYEYLPAFGSVIAAAIGIRRWIAKSPPSIPSAETDQPESMDIHFSAIGFIAYWAIISLLLFSYAGERMPWLTVHIALPMILLCAWVINYFIERLDVKRILCTEGFAILLLLAVGIYALGRVLFELLGFGRAPSEVIPEQGVISTNLLIALAVIILTGMALVFLLRRSRQGFPLGSLTFLLLLAVLYILTTRTAFIAAYQNYDYGTEFLVYAHGERGVKTMLNQIDELSKGFGEGADLEVAYDVADGSGDSGVSWPLTWYFRNSSNSRPFGPEITRDLRSYPLLISSDNNWARLEPLLEDTYQQFEYIRMVWPMQDYWHLTWERVSKVFKSSDLRRALWEIWLNRDYSAYGEYVGRDYSHENWQPSDHMRLYVRNDIAAEVLGIGEPSQIPEDLLAGDPYFEGLIDLEAEAILGNSGVESGQFQSPRAIAVAPDGTLYIADSLNHRIQHLNMQGELLHIWGSFADVAQGSAPGGTFYEPWGIAVGPDGSVYVADTWNHRIQKFTAEGQFITMWGVFGQAASAYDIWGPRAVAVDEKGRVFVADTGNKRIVIYDENGEYLSQFGTGGYTSGQLDEPVGFAFASDGRVYVADTWNTRIQVFEEIEPGFFIYNNEWPIAGWYGQSLENKPYLAISPDDEVCVTDPEGYRVLCFDATGQYLFGWGSYGFGDTQFDLPSGIAFDADGRVWISDSKNGRLMRFQLHE